MTAHYPSSMRSEPLPGAPKPSYRLRAALLGGFRIEIVDADAAATASVRGGSLAASADGGVVLPLPAGRHATHLLAYLLTISPDAPVRRETMRELLWPDQDPQSGRNNLRVTLSRLRSHLSAAISDAADPALRAEAGWRRDPVDSADRVHIGLTPGVWAPSDRDELDRLLNRAEAIQADADAGRATAVSVIDAVLAAAEAYTGTLLAGLEEIVGMDDLPWLFPERESLIEKFLNVLRHALRPAYEAREFDGALRIARHALAADPTRPGSHRDLVRLYLARGEASAARKQWSELEQMLQRTGSPLSPASQALYRQIQHAESGGGGDGVPTLSDAAGGRPASTDPAAASPPARHGGAPAAAAGSPFLPLALTRFFGRKREIREITVLLSGDFDGPAGDGERFQRDDSPARLVTITGPGGNGKTRLAREVALAWSGTSAGARGANAEGAVFWLTLSELSDADSLFFALAEQVLDQMAGGDADRGDAASPAVVLRRLLADRTVPAATQTVLVDAIAAALLQLRPAAGRTGESSAERRIAATANGTVAALLVLDNAEAFLERAAALVNALLARVPSLSCLVTSRIRLGIAGEQEYPLAPLPIAPLSSLPAPLPASTTMSASESGAAVSSVDDDSPAVALFVDRARLAQHRFRLMPSNAEAVTSLCAHLDGIPLAIELAAGWVRTLTPEQIRDRVAASSATASSSQQRFALLVSQDRNAPVRHRSLGAVIESSESLLRFDARQLFRRLSVFRGSFSAEAVQAVCAASPDVDRGAATLSSGVDDGVLLRCLLELAELAECSFVVAEEGRYRLLETLREWGTAQLTPRERRVLRQRHASYYKALAATATRTGAVAALDADMDNLRAAWERSAEGVGPEDVVEGLQFTSQVWELFLRRGQVQEARDRLERHLQHVGAIAAELAATAPSAGSFESGPASRTTAAAAVPAEWAPPWTVSLVGAASLASSQADHAAAERRFAEAHALASGHAQEKPLLIHILNHQGIYLLGRGQLGRARSALERVVALCTELGWTRSGYYLHALLNLAGMHCRNGEFKRAQKLLDECLTVTHRSQGARNAFFSKMQATTFCMIASVGIRTGAGAEQTLRYLMDGIALFEKTGDLHGRLSVLRIEADYWAITKNEPATAAVLYRRALKETWEYIEIETAVYAVEGLAHVSSRLGQAAHAGQLLGGLDALCFKMGRQRTKFEDLSLVPTRKSIAAQIGPVAAQAAYDAGRSMSPAEVVALALAGSDPRSDSHPSRLGSPPSLASERGQL